MNQIDDQHPLREDLIAWMDGDLDAEQRNAIQSHVNICEACRDFLSFAQAFGQTIGALDLGKSEAEACPSLDVLTGYLISHLDEETTRHVHAHLFMCDICADFVQEWRNESEPAVIPLPKALTNHIEEFEKNLRELVDADAGTTETVNGFVVDWEHNTREPIELEIMFGPELRPDGRLQLALGLPEEERFRDCKVDVVLFIQDRVYHLTSTTQGLVVNVDHLFESIEPIQTELEILRRALRDHLRVTIHQ